MKQVLILYCRCALALFLSAMSSNLFAQPVVSEVPLTVKWSGTGGSLYTLQLYFGTSHGSHFCIDSADSIGSHHEEFLPPRPPGGIQDARFVWPRDGAGSTCFDQGSRCDYRPYTAPAQKDTFRVCIQRCSPPACSVPDTVAFSWPNDLASRFTQVTLYYYTHSLNMLTASSLDVTNYFLSDYGNAFIADIICVTRNAIAVNSPNGGEAWLAGSIQNITWAGVNIPGKVKIDLSTDDGLTFPVVVTDSTANDGHEPWLVTAPATSTARIRVTSVEMPSVSDMSDANFAIASLKTITLRDEGGESDSLEYGTIAGATDDIDPSLGEYELPPPPPVGVLDVRWQITGTQGARRDLRDTLGGARVQVTYTGKLQPGEGGYPFHLRWDRNSLSQGYYTLQDGFGGSFFSADMRQQDSVAISDEEVTRFQIIYDSGLRAYNTQAGWNILSLPVTVLDRRKIAVFPTSTSVAYAYTTSGYVARDTLSYGVGYWLRYPAIQSLSVSGSPRYRDTINVVQGWNMIGSISNPVPVANVIQIPTGIVASPYYGYSSTGYSPAATITPMRGYWVKVLQNGKLVLH